MDTVVSLKAKIQSGALRDTFSLLYPAGQREAQEKRWLDALDAFEAKFGAGREVLIVSAPGRTEIGGNHTDHQHGRVLAAGVNLDIICVAAKNTDSVIRIQSKGYPMDTVELDDLSIRGQERNKAASLIRGVAAWFSSHGYAPAGFDAYTTSDVLSGSGLSSSAAFEVAVGNLLSHLFHGGSVTPQQIAVAGQYAENHYFGKPSGIMDQMASSVSSLVEMNFRNPEEPVIRPIPFDFAATGFRLCIVDTRGSHADLTGEYAAIPQEMRKVADFFGKTHLRDVDEAAFFAKLAAVREAAGDRAVLRAMHFFEENERVRGQADALRQGDFGGFLRLINESGLSSMTLLQNTFASSQPQQQGVMLGLALSRRILSGRGAWRVHGGGFAGTIQAFVPEELLAEYVRSLESLFGAGACHVLTIRPVGGMAVG